MPKSRLGNSGFLELVKQLLMGVLGWSSDELRLTKLDASALLHRFLFGGVLFFTSFAILTAAVFTLAETLVGALAEYVHDNLTAGLIVSAALFGLTAILIAVAYASITKKPVARGMVFRRLLGRPRDA